MATGRIGDAAVAALHYSVAHVREIHAALEKIKDDTGRWNKRLAMPRREQRGSKRGCKPPKKVPRQRKTG